MTITPISAFGTAKFIVSTVAGQGNYTSLASAMAAASSGDTIFMRTSVTENVTITPGVNIAGWTGMGYDPTVTITGKLTMTGAGTSTVSNLRLKTNSDFAVAVTGSANSILNLDNCWIDCNNNTGISYTSSGASSAINLYQCNADTGTTGIAHFAHSGAGGLNFQRCIMSNSGGSSTASTASGGAVTSNWSAFLLPITFSGTTSWPNFSYSIFNTATQNTTCITHGSTFAGGGQIRSCEFSSGTAAAISISASCNSSLVGCKVSSSNSNPITGAGSISYDNITFLGTGNGINTTTRTILFNAPISYAPTITVLSSGTAATYTTPTYAKWLRIRMIGGGGGAGGSGSGGTGGAGGNGTASTWSGGSLSAGGGTGSAAGGSGAPTPGGSATGGNVMNITGGAGGPRWAAAQTPGGYGGNGFYGGGGQSGEANGGAGGNGAAPGAGGGAPGATSTTVISPTGGGAGGYVEHVQQSPAATYTYTVGVGGTGGTAGTSGIAGGNGANGQIIIEEYYV